MAKPTYHIDYLHKLDNMLSKAYPDEDERAALIDAIINEQPDLFKKLKASTSETGANNLIKTINNESIRPLVLDMNLTNDEYEAILKDFPIYDKGKKAVDWETLKKNEGVDTYKNAWDSIKKDSYAKYGNDKPLTLNDKEKRKWAYDLGITPEELDKELNKLFLMRQKEQGFKINEELKEKEAKHREEIDDLNFAEKFLFQGFFPEQYNRLMEGVRTGEGPTTLGEAINDPEMKKALAKDIAYNAVDFATGKVGGKVLKAVGASGLGRTATEGIRQAALETGREAASDYEEMDPYNIALAGGMGLGSSGAVQFGVSQLGKFLPQTEEFFSKINRKLYGKEVTPTGQNVKSLRDEDKITEGFYKELEPIATGTGDLTAREKAIVKQANDYMKSIRNSTNLADALDADGNNIAPLFSKKGKRLSNEERRNIVLAYIEENQNNPELITGISVFDGIDGKRVPLVDQDWASGIGEDARKQILDNTKAKGGTLEDKAVHFATNKAIPEAGAVADYFAPRFVAASSQDSNGKRTRTTPPFAGAHEFLKTETQDQKYQRWQKGFQTVEEMQSPEYANFKAQNLKAILGLE